MPPPPLITAVITTFQRPQLLLRAIQSVQRQTFPHLSILVSDSASADETESMVCALAKEDPRISYHRHPKIISSVENYQFGIEQVQTPFFSLLADDDFLLPSFYETALSLLEKYPTAEFFLGSTIDATLQGKYISEEARKWPHQEFFLPSEGLVHAITSYFNWTGALYRTKTVQKHPLNPDVVPGDYDFILRLSAQYPFTFSSSPCAVFTHHPGSCSGNCGLSLISPSFSKIAATIYPLRPKEEWPQLQQAFRRIFQRKLLQIGLQSIAHNRFNTLQDVIEVMENQKIRSLFRCIKSSACFRLFFRKLLACYRGLRHLYWTLSICRGRFLV